MLRTSTAENLQRGCFCIDVTCDNLLDAVKHTVEEESLARIKQLNAELVSKLREYAAEEQALATKVARFEGQLVPLPPVTGLIYFHQGTTSSLHVYAAPPFIREPAMRLKMVANGREILPRVRTRLVREGVSFMQVDTLVPSV